MLFRGLPSLALILSLMVLLVGCNEKPLSDPRTETPLVRPATVETAGNDYRAYTGTVAARVESDLGFRVAGKVLERLVDTGQTVKRGQTLMRIDPIDLKLGASAEREAVAAARARFQQAAEDEERFRDLRGTGAVSASDYDQVKAAADAAKAQLRAAEARAEVAINATRYTDLVADVDGVVVDTLAEPGQVVSAGQTVVRLAHAGAREAVIQLPETLRPALGYTGQATLFGNGDLTVPTRLRQLSDKADPLTRTFEARFVLDGKLRSAPLGATVTIKIPNAHSSGEDEFLVPIGSLLDAGKGPGVWVIDGDPQIVSWRPVQVQRLRDDSALINAELKQGDVIVALGAHLLSEGDQVRVANPNVIAATGERRP